MNETRIGVYVCWCGTNIAKMVDVEKVAEEAKNLPCVAISKTYKYMCSDPGQELVINDIKENNLNRIVIAACSPRIHELTFRKALEKAGLNPYMLEMANIREHVSWVHTDKERSTKKAMALLTGAVNRVALHDELKKRYVDVHPATLVIGGGITGLSSAIMLADAGKKVFLVEKSGETGGTLNKVDLTFPNLLPAHQLLEPLKSAINNHPNIEVFLNTEIKEVFGYVGNFETKINNENEPYKFGNIVVATGLKPLDPTVIPEYGYGKIPDVVTSLEFEKMLLNGNVTTKEGKTPKRIAIIHCAGSRNNNYHEYCSRTCCLTALKFINQIKSEIPSCYVFDLYADMRAFGKGCEELYTRTSNQEDVIFMMFDQREELPVLVESKNKKRYNVKISFIEKLSGEDVDVPADIVVLMTGMEAHNEAKKVGHSVGVSIDSNGFFIEKHPKLDPVATTTDGVFIVGTCQSPKDIPDSISQARAAVARILGTLAKGTKAVEVTTAEVDEDICCGCQTCIKVCPYTAISYDETKNVSVVNEILCKGCGTCGSACPTGAISCKHYTDQQILSQIEGLLNSEQEVI